MFSCPAEAPAFLRLLLVTLVEGHCLRWASEREQTIHFRVAKFYFIPPKASIYIDLPGLAFVAFAIVEQVFVKALGATIAERGVTIWAYLWHLGAKLTAAYHWQHGQWMLVRRQSAFLRRESRSIVR